MSKDNQQLLQILQQLLILHWNGLLLHFFLFQIGFPPFFIFDTYQHVQFSLCISLLLRQHY